MVSTDSDKESLILQNSFEWFLVFVRFIFYFIQQISYLCSNKASVYVRYVNKLFKGGCCVFRW